MRPVVLCILDGVGIRHELKGNAFLKAKRPNFDYIWKNFPHSKLDASGRPVGLPDGQMGTSEVGHMNIGAGRIVYQPLQFINEAIENKSFFENKNIKEVIEHTKQNNSKLHILGLLSDGGIHSHIDQLMSLIDMCKIENVKEIYFHIFTDGRDTLNDSAYKYLERLENKIKEIEMGKIVTIAGRYYAMDRDKRWDRLELAYNNMIKGTGDKFNSPKEVIEYNYQQNQYDEFIKPAILDESGLITDNDGIIIFNFRPDRLREIGSALTSPNFNGFDRKQLKNIKLVTMMPVGDELVYKHAFELPDLKNILGEYISKQGLKQLRIAETEKYAHVTYFFDGGKEQDYPNEKKILIPSPKVPTYDLKPEMSAYEITETLIKELSNFDIVILNFANCDMVGHTGDFNATVKAVETVDECIGKIYRKVRELDGVLIITADHGNCDYMIDENNHVVTSHSTNQVPFVVTTNIELQDGKLGDIAPTILKLLDLEIPSEMTGENLIK